MRSLLTLRNALLHLVYPHICATCGDDHLPAQSQLCIKCLHALPHTHYEKFARNPVEKMLYGRLPVQEATAMFYFNKSSVVQQVMHQVKYRGNTVLGEQLGGLMGHAIKNSRRFNDIEALVPLPLFIKKEKERGYNQAAVLCNGMARVLQVPIIKNAVSRTAATDSQTQKDRVERWQNMEGKFVLTHPQLLTNKHVLLIDDVITTGATLEACGAALLKTPGLQLSVATLCCAGNV